MYLETEVIQTIKMSNVLITTFDWIVSRENDIIAMGDQVDDSFINLEWKRVYPEARLGVTSIGFHSSKFYALPSHR